MTEEKPRSRLAHNRIFALISSAYNHWPEAHEFKPDNAEHLRAFLLVKAKHRTIKQFYLSDDASEYARLLPIIVLSMLDRHAWAWADGNCLNICVAESIAWDKCGHDRFGAICADVEAVLEREAGLKAEDLLRVAA